LRDGCYYEEDERPYNPRAAACLAVEHLFVGILTARASGLLQDILPSVLKASTYDNMESRAGMVLRGEILYRRRNASCNVMIDWPPVK
ncbi:hypothetical protein Trydic_g18432, partial [Trypoxylus dichotomus]